MTDFSEYYFRVKQNGALVFRFGGEGPQRRVEMQQIAVVNIRNGEIKPQGDRPLSEQDIEEIQRWMRSRRDLLKQRELDDVYRLVEQLNHMAQWVQSGASDAQLEEIEEALLMATHDLRSVLVRKKADRITKGAS